MDDLSVPSFFGAEKEKERKKRDREKRRVCLWGKVCIRRASPLINLLLCGECVTPPKRRQLRRKKKKNENTKQKRERGSSNKRESPPLPSYFPTCQQVHTKTPPLSNIDLYRYMRTLVRKTSLQSALLLILFPHKNKSIT